MSDISWARRIVSRFKRMRILVVGDAMLDRYIYGTVSRISPEAPVPVVSVRSERAMPGGAANVARNITALGGGAVLCAVTGRDRAGAELRRSLEAEGVSTEGVSAPSGVETVVKTRVIAERQQVVRVDWEQRLALGPGPRARICAGIRRLAARASGVLVEDYGKGLVSQDIVDAAAAGAAAAGVPAGMDPKENTAIGLNGITIVTPNRKEAFILARMPETQPEEAPLRDEPLLRAAAALLDMWRPRYLIITLGAQGMLVVSRDRKAAHLPTRAREVFDVSGAGDTVIACAMLSLAAGADGLQAAELANCAAGVVVGKLGTACCTAGELLSFLGAKVEADGIGKIRGLVSI